MDQAKAWSVIKYEVEMYASLERRRVSDEFPELPWDLRNATIESLVLHVRTLCDFLTSKELKPPKKGQESTDILLKNLLGDEFQAELVQELGKA